MAKDLKDKKSGRKMEKVNLLSDPGIQSSHRNPSSRDSPLGSRSKSKNSRSALEKLADENQNQLKINKVNQSLKTSTRATLDQSLTDDEIKRLKLWLVFVLCLIQFLSNSAFSQMAPFYPIEAKMKGVSVIWVGMIIGIMAMLQIVSSFIVGKFLHKIGGRNPIIMIGSLLIIFQTSMLGYIDYVQDTNTFIILSFAAQILGGLGAGANATASMAILSSYDHSEREMYIGWVEAANGVGLLFGPLLGSLLYTIGGYVAPFATFGKSGFPFDHLILV